MRNISRTLASDAFDFLLMLSEEKNQPVRAGLIKQKCNYYDKPMFRTHMQSLIQNKLVKSHIEDDNPFNHKGYSITARGRNIVAFAHKLSQEIEQINEIS